MLSLLTCSAPPLDEYDPFSPPPSPAGLPRIRRASRTLSFIRTPSKRKVSKMSIGAPANFRHEFHLGMDIVSSDPVSLWDATRFLDELRAQQNTPSTSSTAPSLAPSAQSLAPPCTPTAQKRNSITPQKRKPVPALVPPCPPRPADVPLPPSPVDAPTDIPLPPSPALVPLLAADESPFVTQTAKDRWDAAIGEIEHALRASDHA